MKVFLSWSGNLSHQVALVMRDWLPSVIQSIKPYVSSEDIDKGARWSTDIASQLEDSAFGILCVTKDNITAPWLTFEAGALSKTIDKSFVCPFLFDIKRSEVDGPILQFQSTIFERGDVERLMATLNRACESEGLSTERLERAFEVWYPNLEAELRNLSISVSPSDPEASEPETESPKVQELLEEILELSRTSQKLLRTPEGPLSGRLDDLSETMAEVLSRLDRSVQAGPWDRFAPDFLEEVMRISTSGRNPFVGAHLTLALLRDPMPWVYESGTEVIKIFRSRKSKQEKMEHFEEFYHLLEFSLGHPALREIHGARWRRSRVFFGELPHMLRHIFMEALSWRR